jgi:hypothetical protein
VRLIQLRHFLDVQPFGKGETEGIDIAADEHAEDLEWRQRVIEAILARPKASAAPRPPQRRTKQTRVTDDFGRGKLPPDFRTGSALTNCDELLRSRVALVGLVKLRPAKPPYDGSSRGQQHDDHHADRQKSTHGHPGSPAG